MIVKALLELSYPDLNMQAPAIDRFYRSWGNPPLPFAQGRRMALDSLSEACAGRLMTISPYMVSLIIYHVDPALMTYKLMRRAITCGSEDVMTSMCPLTRVIAGDVLEMLQGGDNPVPSPIEPGPDETYQISPTRLAAEDSKQLQFCVRLLKVQERFWPSEYRGGFGSISLTKAIARRKTSVIKAQSVVAACGESAAAWTYIFKRLKEKSKPAPVNQNVPQNEMVEALAARKRQRLYVNISYFFNLCVRTFDLRVPERKFESVFSGTEQSGMVKEDASKFTYPAIPASKTYPPLDKGAMDELSDLFEDYLDKEFWPAQGRQNSLLLDELQRRVTLYGMMSIAHPDEDAPANLQPYLHPIKSNDWLLKTDGSYCRDVDELILYTLGTKKYAIHFLHDKFCEEGFALNEKVFEDAFGQGAVAWAASKDRMQQETRETISVWATNASEADIAKRIEPPFGTNSPDRVISLDYDKEFLEFVQTIDPDPDVDLQITALRERLRLWSEQTSAQELRRLRVSWGDYIPFTLRVDSLPMPAAQPQAAEIAGNRAPEGNEVASDAAALGANSAGAGGSGAGAPGANNSGAGGSGAPGANHAGAGNPGAGGGARARGGGRGSLSSAGSAGALSGVAGSRRRVPPTHL
jgi:hypothetical protein